SPRYDGRVTPLRVSVSSERGLAYWPAKRPTRITGFLAPCVSTRLICSRIFNLRVMSSAEQSERLSAQSPPCSRNRLPTAASPICCFNAATSHEVTRGGKLGGRRATAARSCAGEYTGCCSAGFARHEPGVHETILLAT